MKKMINTTQVSFFITLSFMIFGALVLLGLVYVIEGNAVTLREQVSAIAYTKAQQQERYETERLLDETKEERERLAQFVLTEGSVIDFITNIEALAQSLQLSFNTQTITPEKTKDTNFDELSMNFDFSGSKPVVEYMISILETTPHHSYIRDLTVRQSEGGAVWNVNLVLVVTIATYDT